MHNRIPLLILLGSITVSSTLPSSAANLERSLFAPSTVNSSIFGIDVVASNTTYLVGSQGQGVTEFDPVTGSVVRSYSRAAANGSSSFGREVETDGQTVAIADYANLKVALFSETTGAYLRSVDLPSESDIRNANSIAIDGDLLVVSDAGSDAHGNNAGSAWMYQVSTGQYLGEIAKPSPTFLDLFGTAVAIVGDTIAISTQHAFGVGASAPAPVYLYDRHGTLQGTLTGPSPGNEGQFGDSLTAVGENKLLVGANVKGVSGVGGAGAAYLYDVTTGQILHTFLNPNPQLGGNFGIAAAATDDRIVIGAHAMSDGATRSGIAYVYSATSGALLDTLHNPTPANEDFFGLAVAALGNTFLIGAPNDGTKGPDAGAAYQFTAVPEPSTIVLIAFGAFAVFIRMRLSAP